MKTNEETATSVELKWLDRFGAFGYRIDGIEWAKSAELAGATPRNDDISGMAEAVVAIGWAYGLKIHADEVCVDGLAAGFFADLIYADPAS